jgi:lipoprotein-releasing system ATP-binding protein
MAEPLLIAKSVTRILPGDIEVTLVKDASLEVMPQEFVTITGPSGSGKSSLLYLLGLLDKPTSGEIILQGKPTSKMSESNLAELRLEKLGFIFQFHFLLPEFTALENVMMPMKRLGKLSEKDMKIKAEGLLTTLGLEAHMHKPPKKMSGGQAQRVAIARALSNDPVLILADEPTGNLDTASSQNVQDILRDIAHKQGRAVIAVTHDMDFAARADRRIHIVDGKIEPKTGPA